MTLPVLLHIPHASTSIPQEYQSGYLLDSVGLALENLRLTDMYTDEIYDLPGAEKAIFPVSRFLVDAERFSDDDQESMAARGMGALYTVTTHLEPLRPAPSPELRQELLARYYHPHHARLNEWANLALTTHGKGLLIDCHSFPSQALPYELENMKLHRPEFCIGTDSFHTPRPVADALISYFKDLGYDTHENKPFAGALTPAQHYRKSPDIYAFMIEIRKDLYMDEATGAKTPRFETIKNHVTGAMALARHILNTL